MYVCIHPHRLSIRMQFFGLHFENNHHFSSSRKAINGQITRLWIFSSDFHGLLEEAELFHLCVENKYVCFFSLMHADIQPYLYYLHTCMCGRSLSELL